MRGLKNEHAVPMHRGPSPPGWWDAAFGDPLGQLCRQVGSYTSLLRVRIPLLAGCSVPARSAATDRRARNLHSPGIPEKSTGFAD